MKNLLTDIAGVRVGHADDAKVASGVTAVVFDRPAVAAMDVRGGGPGIREGALLDLANTVETVDAFALAGGSAFGLDAGDGVQAWLAEQGRGFTIRDAVIPIVPGAIIFDLLNGGDKKWGRFAPYRDLGYAAAAAADTTFALGSVGAGLGATTANYKGGVGSASAELVNGVRVAAIAVVNAVGSITVGDGPWFWAAPFEQNKEFGGRGLPAGFTQDMLAARLKGGENATEELRKDIVTHVRKVIGPIATPDVLLFAPGLPKTRSGKIMRRILRKVAENQFDALGDTSTLADPSVVDSIVANHKQLFKKAA